MKEVKTKISTEKNKVERIIGKYQGSTKEPLVVITAGVHGNEPSGIYALKRIFQYLNKTEPDFKGTLLGMAGNKRAFNNEKRFIDMDLNRTWTEENIKSPNYEIHEHAEMMDIISHLDELKPESFERRYFLDCHTTSSNSLPYASVNDRNNNMEWVARFPVYAVKGFSKMVRGTIDNYFCDRNFTGFVMEAGQHLDKASEDHQAAVILLTLSKLNGLNLEEVDCYPHCVDVLRKNLKGERKSFEIIYRHEISDKDTFKMKPGFKNFEKIKQGDFLAEHNGKEILSKWDAHLFMPLYQSQGNDGFFVIKDINAKD